MGRFVRHPQASGGFSGGDVTSAIGLPDGTAATPSLYFTSDADGSGTGIFRGAANALAFSANGNEVGRFTTSTLTIANNVDIYQSGGGAFITNTSGALLLGAVASTSHSLGTGDVLVGGALEVDGAAWFDGTLSLYSGADRKFYVDANGNISFGQNLVAGNIAINNSARGSSISLTTEAHAGGAKTGNINVFSGNQTATGNYATGDIRLYSGDTTTDGDTGDVNIYTGTAGAGAADAGDIFMSVNGAPGTGTTAIQILGNGGGILMPNLPTSDPAVAGQLWSNSGVLTVSAG